MFPTTANCSCFLQLLTVHVSYNCQLFMFPCFTYGLHCMFISTVAMVTLRQLSIIVLLSITGANASWMQKPYTNDSFNEQRKYGENVTLTCSAGDSETVDYWVLPDTTVMEAGDVIDFKTLDGVASWRVSTDGGNMDITLVQERHFGLYYCVLKTSGKHYIIKRALNYRGPYFGDLWPKYKWNVISGCGTAGGVLAAAVLMAMVHAVVTCGNRVDSDSVLQRFSPSGVTGTMNKSFSDSDNDGVTTVTISTLDVRNGRYIKTGQQKRYENVIIDTTIL